MAWNRPQCHQKTGAPARSWQLLASSKTKGFIQRCLWQSMADESHASARLSRASSSDEDWPSKVRCAQAAGVCHVTHVNVPEQHV
jgi:hypothetical protein